MKAEQIGKPEFVPVIVTLESQEEVDSLFVLGNHPTVLQKLPALSKLWTVLQSFVSDQRRDLYDHFRTIIK